MQSLNRPLQPAQALESVLNNYRIRHAQCVSSTTLPNKYIVMSMADDYAGLGNQFPSVITGDRPTQYQSAAPYNCSIIRTHQHGLWR